MANLPLDRMNKSQYMGSTHPHRGNRGQADEWRGKARKATQMIVAVLPQTGTVDIQVGRKVIKAAREALGPADGETMHQPFELPTKDGLGTEVQECVSTDGIYRLVINDAGLDRSNDVAAETFMQVIQRELGHLGL